MRSITTAAAFIAVAATAVLGVSIPAQATETTTPPPPSSCSGANTSTASGSCADTKSSTASAEETSSSVAAVSLQGKTVTVFVKKNGIKKLKKSEKSDCPVVKKSQSQPPPGVTCFVAKRGFKFINSGLDKNGKLVKWQDQVGSMASSTPHAKRMRFVKRHGNWLKAGTPSGKGNCANPVWFYGKKPSLTASQVVQVKSWASWKFTVKVSATAHATATASSKAWCNANGTSANASASGTGEGTASATASFLVKGRSKAKATAKSESLKLQQQLKIKATGDATANATAKATAKASAEVSCNGVTPPPPPPPVQPTYTCDVLHVTPGSQSVVVDTFRTSQTGGAEFKSAVIDWGDGKSAASTSPVGTTHDYGKYGTFTIKATANFAVNGADKSATSSGCQQVVTFKAPPPPPVPAPKLIDVDTINDVLINNTRTITVTGTVAPNHTAALVASAKNGGSITVNKNQTVKGNFTTTVTYKAPSEVPGANNGVAAGKDQVTFVLTQDDGQSASISTNQFVITKPIPDPL